MTVDPNKPNDPPADPPPGDPPAPVPVVASEPVDLDAVADRVVEKLMKAAGELPAPAPAVAATASPERSSYSILVQQASDPEHPLYATAVSQLSIMRRQAEEEQWNALGCAPGHAARSLFAAAPHMYAGNPRFAFQEWQLQEARRKETDQEAAKRKADEEAAAAVRGAAPGMPSRSVDAATGSGRLKMTREEFDRRVVNEPDLDDKLDRGQIELTTI